MSTTYTQTPDNIVWGQPGQQGMLSKEGLYLPEGATIRIGPTGTAQNIISSPVESSMRINAGKIALTAAQVAVTSSLSTVVAVMAVPVGGLLTGDLATSNSGITVTLSAGSTLGAFTILSWQTTITGSKVISHALAATTTFNATASWIAVGT